MFFGGGGDGFPRKIRTHHIDSVEVAHDSEGDLVAPIQVDTNNYFI